MAGLLKTIHFGLKALKSTCMHNAAFKYLAGGETKEAGDAAPALQRYRYEA